MPSVVSAATQFVESIFNIFLSLGQSIFAVFHAIFALVGDSITGSVKLVAHVVSMFTELFSGAIGFVAGMFGLQQFQALSEQPADTYVLKGTSSQSLFLSAASSRISNTRPGTGALSRAHPLNL
jgi:hypothetical protein